jgi:hypothetical protein
MPSGPGTIRLIGDSVVAGRERRGCFALEKMAQRLKQLTELKVAWRSGGPADVTVA